MVDKLKVDPSWNPMHVFFCCILTMHIASMVLSGIACNCCGLYMADNVDTGGAALFSSIGSQLASMFVA